MPATKKQQPKNKGGSEEKIAEPGKTPGSAEGGDEADMSVDPGRTPGTAEGDRRDEDERS